MVADAELRVLHLDDDPFELERVRLALEKNAIDCSFRVESLATVEAYKARIRTAPAPDIVILDIHIGDGDETGVNLAMNTRKLAPRTVILMCSTADDIGTIADCLNAGADDFISKQSDKGELSLRVLNSYRLAQLKLGVEGKGKGKARAPEAKLVGATLERIAMRVPRIVDSAITAIFIRGESGTGKEVVADIFGNHLAAGTPFVKVNCGAIAPTLLESELFGHVKGAFTGATTDKRGLFEAASGGFIFLDEVATLSPAAQVALLRVLENHEVLRVGATKPSLINVRVLSATNEPMEQLVKQGKFRGDLWQRLRESEIILPPLRERPAEIRPLIEHFCRSMPGGPYQVSGPVMEVLSNCSWREGNVRELRNCLRAMTEMHVNKLLTPLSIPERIWDELGDRPGADGQDAKADAANAGAAKSQAGELHIRWDAALGYNLDVLTECVLLEIVRILFRDKGKLSLRGLALETGVSRSTLSTRLKAMIQRNLIDITELSKMVGINSEG